MSPTDSLSSLDRFGSRKAIIPAEVKGHYRKWRDRVYAVLLLIFLVLPWIRINGLQALWLDIPNRRFEIFGGLFLAHDAPLLFLISMLAVLALAIVTALWGRVWCGWACPQTVFIDAVYRRIEIWTEGGYIARRRLREAPWTWDKLRKVGLKWFLFFVVSSLFAHSFIAYFSGSDRLIEMIQAPPSQNWSYFLLVSSVTGLLLFNFGWFREQFCIIMCPYGRFQSVLQDRDTVTVMYDEKRGEPRKGVGVGGDCVSCNRCVQVCPTGIDIRHGVQMECIGCTACIDACDEIMTKVKKPTGLIRYGRLSGSTRAHWWRPRVAAYVGFALLLAGVLVFSLAGRQPFTLTVLRAKDSPYQVLPDGQVLNHFKAHYRNQTHGKQVFEIRVPLAEVARGVELKTAAVEHTVGAGASVETHFFLVFPRELLSADGRVRVKLTVRSGATESPLEVTAVGPF